MVAAQPTTDAIGRSAMNKALWRAQVDCADHDHLGAAVGGIVAGAAPPTARASDARRARRNLEFLRMPAQL